MHDFCFHDAVLPDSVFGYSEIIVDDGIRVSADLIRQTTAPLRIFSFDCTRKDQVFNIISVFPGNIMSDVLSDSLHSYKY